MNTATIAPRLEAAELPTPLIKERNRHAADFAELVKARLTFLVLVTTAVGYYLGAKSPVSVGGLIHTVFGTALAAGGAAALNQWWERTFDALMHRTQTRPLPAGRMKPAHAAVIGIVLSVSGVAYLAFAANLLSAILAAVTVLIYLFAYTPLKRISVTNTLVGAVPGAIPPLIGWAAARGTLTWQAWSLFAIMFCWQMPHFFAIAWMYREDYARAGFRMLSNSGADGKRSGRQALVFAVLLINASCLPAFLRLSSPTFLALEILLSVGFAVIAGRFAFHRDRRNARLLFLTSIIYLPALLLVLVLTKS